MAAAADQTKKTDACTVYSDLATNVVIALLRAGVKPGSELDKAIGAYLTSSKLPSSLDTLNVTPLCFVRGLTQRPLMPFDVIPRALPATLDALNKLVSDLTGGTIPNAYTPTAMTATLLLMCCIAFEKTFADAFSKPSQGQFTRIDGSKSACMMMVRTCRTPTATWQSPSTKQWYDMVDIVFDDDFRNKLRIALPQDTQALPDISDSEWRKIAASTYLWKKARLKMPPFSCRNRFDLLKMIRDLFPALTERGALDRFFPGAILDDAFQETFLEVTRTGTKAGAVASASVMKSAGGALLKPVPQIIDCDHPFAYAIIVGTTVLFSGRLMSPTDIDPAA